MRKSKFGVKVTGPVLDMVTPKCTWVTCTGLRSDMGSDEETRESFAH